MAVGKELAIYLHKTVVKPYILWAILLSTNSYVLEYISAFAVWSPFLALFCTRLMYYLVQRTRMRDPEDSLPPPIAWVEIMTKALDSKLETARLLRRDYSRETAKICKRKVVEKLVREVPPEQVFKELDEEILHGLHHLSEDAKQRLEDLKNKWGVDATTPFKKIDVEKLSDADCRAALPKALEAAGFLMLCHDANKEIRRLENPLNVAKTGGQISRGLPKE